MKNELAKIVFALGAYYDKKLSPEQIKMYVEDLTVLTPHELNFAIKQYRSDPANSFFPLPSKLIGIIKPVENDQDLGRLVAGWIMSAVLKFGSYRVQEAKTFMGEIAWEVVKLQGGWSSICALDTEDLKAEQPRWRDLAISVNKRSKLGKLNQAPSFSGISESSKTVSNLIQQSLKSIEN
jgi:hypothetical protein